MIITRPADEPRVVRFSVDEKETPFANVGELVNFLSQFPPDMEVGTMTYSRTQGSDIYGADVDYDRNTVTLWTWH